MSSQGFSAVKPGAYLPALINGGRTARIRTQAYQGRSYACNPRQLAFTLSAGEHPHAEITKLNTPNMFWESIGSDRKGSGWVLGRFPGVPGKPTGPVEWAPLSAAEVPSLAGGILARASSELGAERGMENIVSCRAEGQDVLASHVSRSDRKLIKINSDGWETNHAEREKLIQELDAILLTHIEKSELSSDGTTLTLYSKILDHQGNPVRHELDISCLNLNPKGIYSNPEDRDLSVKIIALDPLEDCESLERNKVTLFHNQAVELTDDTVVRAFREEDGTIHLQLDPIIFEDLGYASVRATIMDGGERRITVSTRSGNIEIAAATEDEIRANASFAALEDKNLQDAVLRVFQESRPDEIKGKSRQEILKQLDGIMLSRPTLRAIRRALMQVYYVDNFPVDRVNKIRSRYALQFHSTRESRFKEVLGAPLNEGESVVVTRVLSSAEIVHLDKANGRKRGDREIIPLNFDPTDGHPEDYESVILNPFPHAMFKTMFLHPIETALAGQHLLDPYITGTEIMAAVWPKADQLGFFGIFMSAAMAFPYGSMFTNPADNPWYLRSFGTIPHSIFDAKMDVGTKYYLFTGSPRLENCHEQVGAAMVTGPNTDTANPVRTGRLFNCRIPGRRGFIKTAIPGFYIMVIEDAESSYFFMTMFGLKTATTILPLSAGGGLDNYQLALTVQRSQRWNAGKSLYLMDAAQNMWIDLVRGNSAYRFMYNHTRRVWMANLDTEIPALKNGMEIMLQNGETACPAEKAEQEKALKLASDPGRPVKKMYKYHEAREWLNVGTWYFVSAAKLAAYLSVPLLVLTTLLPISPAGIAFFFVCIGASLFGWPFWAIQMAKVGVNPKFILSISPVHLFWGDLPMHTMLKSGIDVERLSLGRFRISDKRLGNRIPARDKRTAFWVGAVLPTAFGGALLGAVAVLSTAVGILPLAACAFPVIAGIVASRYLHLSARKIVPNPRAKSFWKSLLLWTVKVTPWAAGIALSALWVPSLAVLSVPISLALMAGGWSVFMGLNIFNEFRIYHREQEKTYALPEPNPLPGTLRKYQADSWRNTLKEAFGLPYTTPTFAPLEFTRKSIDPYRLWDEVNGAKGDLLSRPGGDPLANLNNLISGEGEPPIMLDLLEELYSVRPESLANICEQQYRWWKPVSSRSARIARLEKSTRADREKIAARERPERDAQKLNLTQVQYDRIRELNRLVLEETFPEYAPGQ